MSLFSVRGSKKVIERIIGVLFYPEQERARRAGIAMREQGRGLQEQIKAIAALIAVEEKLVNQVVARIDKMRKAGMTDDAIKAMATADFSRLARFAQAIDFVERFLDLGRLRIASQEEQEKL